MAAPASATVHAPAKPAKALVRAGLAAQGGEVALRAIATIEWRASGYRNELEQFERPEGPYVTEFDEIAELHDVAGGRLATTIKAAIPPFPSFSQGLVADRTTAMRKANVANSAVIRPCWPRRARPWR